MMRQSLHILSCIMIALLLNACVMQQSPAPVHQLNASARYGQIDRGSYKGRTYKVKKGETLSFISYITGRSIDNIVKYNHLNNPNTIYPGQVLRLTAPSAPSTVKKQWRVTPAAIASVATKAKTSSKAVTTAKKNVVSKKKVVSKKSAAKKSSKKVTPKKTARTVKKSTASKKISYSKVSSWRWPTRGKIIKRYSSVKGSKGVNIAGKKGQPIYATAPGKVVYAGNALRGYGNIIIIKHNSDYLSAYAHNDSLLVKENQRVKSGQKIALMGKTSSPIVQLHFEIRYKGKSVDPLRYLP